MPNLTSHFHHIVFLVINKVKSDDSWDFIYSVEFKDSELTQLAALQSDSVQRMGRALASMQDGDPKRHRLVGALLRKLSQPDLVLSSKIRAEVKEALISKLGSVSINHQKSILRLETTPAADDSAVWLISAKSNNINPHIDQIAKKDKRPLIGFTAALVLIIVLVLRKKITKKNKHRI